MRYLSVALLLGSISHASIAIAEPCVGAAFDRPVAGAIDVLTRVVDIPSSQFPGLWQQGTLDGFFYTLYANGDGFVKPSRKFADWSIDFSCRDQQENCVFTNNGITPEAARNTADFLSRCLMTDDPVRKPALLDIPLPVVAPVPVACGLAALADEGAGTLLQRLVVLAGGDPGPIDGFPGALTRDALITVLGDQGRDIAFSDAISVLDDLICGRPE